MRPEINFSHPDFADFLEQADDRDAATDWLTATINDCLDKVAPIARQHVTRIDFVYDGHTSRMTPERAPEGLVIRLDLGQETYWPGDDPVALEKLRSRIMHELYHLGDRLDPEFQFDDDFHGSCEAEPLRPVVNALWDVNIEARKLRDHGLRPIVPKDGEDAQAGVRRNLMEAIGDDPKLPGVFEELWTKRVTHPMLLDWARQIPLKEGSAESQWQKARTRIDQN